MTGSDDLTVVRDLTGTLLRLEVADVDVDDRGAGSGGGDRVVRDLFGGDGNVFALARGVSGSGDGTGEDDLAIHDDSFFESVLLS